MNTRPWTIVNYAANGRSYGPFETREAAMAAAKARHQYKYMVIDIDEDRRIVYFREEVAGF